ncbi:unnamed protein product, partial [Nesidiocoris tenuis]
LKQSITQETAGIPDDMVESVMRNFGERLQECITESEEGGLVKIADLKSSRRMASRKVTHLPVKTSAISSEFIPPNWAKTRCGRRLTLFVIFPARMWPPTMPPKTHRRKVPNPIMARKRTNGDELYPSPAGSIVYACQPLGSVLSGLVLEPLGRKYAMMAVNVPHILGWYLLYSASTHVALYIAAVIMGLGVGFMEAPIITYIGEICEPHLRGTLTSYSNLFVTFGMTTVYVFGTLVDWRTAALIFMNLPILTILALTQIPETPLWLMARGREADAKKSLQWLRGWVSPQAVEKEVNELKRYSDASYKKRLKGYDNPAVVLDENTPNGLRIMAFLLQVKGSEQEIVEKEPSKMELLTQACNDFFRPAVLKPFAFIIVFFFISNWTGVSSTRPYLIKLIEEFQFPIEPYRAARTKSGVGRRSRRFLSDRVFGHEIVPFAKTRPRTPLPVPTLRMHIGRRFRIDLADDARNRGENIGGNRAGV